MLALLEDSGELENTVVVMSGDNGLPFPRCKATLCDMGAHVPLAIEGWTAYALGYPMEWFAEASEASSGSNGYRRLFYHANRST